MAPASQFDFSNAKQLTINNSSDTLDYWMIQSKKSAPNQLIPHLIINGAFEDAATHRELLNAIAADAPVIVVSLPGLGRNICLPKQPNAKYWIAALVQLLDHLKVERCTLQGGDLAATLATALAAEHPTRVERVIVYGVCHKLRKLWRLLLSEIRAELLTDRASFDVQAFVLYLLTEDAISDQRLHRLYTRYFHHEFERFTEIDWQRFQLMIDGLLDVHHMIGFPECPILVCAGEYDQLTLPFEQADYADECPLADFVLVDGVDHYLRVDRNATMVRLIHTYLLKEDYRKLDGVCWFAPGTYQEYERRGEPRLIPKHGIARLYTRFVDVPIEGELLDAESDEPKHSTLNNDSSTVPRFCAVTIKDINFNGCRIELDRQLFRMHKNAPDLVLYLENPKLKLKVLAFDQGRHATRCLFRHANYNDALLFRQVLNESENFQMPEENDGREVAGGN
ncbi:MAG: alpha/beta hydrolase [Pseudomonadota bacterium]